MADRHLRFEQEWLSAAVDGELTAEELAAFEHTVAADPALQREYDVLRALKSCVRRAAPDAELPAALTARLHAGLDAIDAERPAVTWQRWLKPVAVLAAAAALVVVFQPLLETGPQPADEPVQLASALDLSAETLSQTHRDWQAHFATEPPATETPQQMAAALSERLGYDVVPPDPGRLHAELHGCASCDHSVPGAVAAVFVMTRDGEPPLTLFEVGGEACKVLTPGFTDATEQGVQIATANGVSLATWSIRGVHAVLAAEQSDAEALAKLAPRAVQVASIDLTPRLVRVALLR